MSTPAKTPNKVREPREKREFPPLSQRPVFLCYDKDFVANGEKRKAGVYWHGIKSKKKEGEVLVDQWICSILKVLCIVRASAGNEHSYLIEYIPHGESSPRRSLLSQALLLSRPEEPLKALRDLGVSVLYTNLVLVRAYLTASTCASQSTGRMIFGEARK